MSKCAYRWLNVRALQVGLGERSALCSQQAALSLGISDAHHGFELLFCLCVLCDELFAADEVKLLLTRTGELQYLAFLLELLHQVFEHKVGQIRLGALLRRAPRGILSLHVLVMRCRLEAEAVHGHHFKDLFLTSVLARLDLQLEGPHFVHGEMIT